jgi:thiosulfate/3-mercaptopyruvate sulfurtransferase
MTANELGPLVTTEWVSAHLGEPNLRIVHVSVDRKAYDAGHLPGAIFVDLHVDLAKGGSRPETGAARRMYMVPTREETAASLAAWGVAPGDRVVFYDDAGQGRHAIRGYWLLRLYGFPADRVHVMNGGLPVWQKEERATTAEETRPVPAGVDATERLHERDDSLIATAEEVLEWSREAATAGGPTHLLDVRTVDEYLGTDVRARCGGHVPGARHRNFTDFVAPDGRLRSGEQALAILRATGVEPEDLRATYCQGGIRAALAWFVLHELGGLSQVRNYAGSWEEWGNRPDLPVEK